MKFGRIPHYWGVRSHFFRTVFPQPASVVLMDFAKAAARARPSGAADFSAAWRHRPAGPRPHPSPSAQGMGCSQAGTQSSSMEASRSGSVTITSWHAAISTYCQRDWLLAKACEACTDGSTGSVQAI